MSTSSVTTEIDKPSIKQENRMSLRSWIPSKCPLRLATLHDLMNSRSKCLQYLRKYYRAKNEKQLYDSQSVILNASEYAIKTSLEAYTTYPTLDQFD